MKGKWFVGFIFAAFLLGCGSEVKVVQCPPCPPPPKLAEKKTLESSEKPKPSVVRKRCRHYSFGTGIVKDPVGDFPITFRCRR